MAATMTVDGHHFYPLEYLLPHSERRVALLVLNQKIQLEKSLFTELWQRAVLRGVADGAIHQIHETFGPGGDSIALIPNFISGDFDSTKPELLELYRSKGVVVIQTPDQNKTDFEKCLEISLKELELDAREAVEGVVVIAGLGGRFDHEMANINTILRHETTIPLYLHNDESIAFALKPGRNTIHLTEEFRGKWCGLIPYESCTVSTQGLKWNLKEAEMKFGGLVSTSNEATGEFVEVECDKKIIFTMGVDFGKNPSS